MFYENKASQVQRMIPGILFAFRYKFKELNNSCQILFIDKQIDRIDMYK